MKKLFFLFTLVFVINSCSKTVEFSPKEALINNGPWEFVKATTILNGKFSEYNRTVKADPFDTWYLEFNDEKSGFLSNGVDKWPLKYVWKNTDFSSLSFNLQQSTPLDVTWENLTISETKLAYTEIINSNGRQSISQMILRPKK
jgi:hypothetical protein